MSYALASLTIDQLRRTHPSAQRRWNAAEEAKLTELFNDGVTISDLSKALGRTEGAINARLVKLGLIEDTFRAQEADAEKTRDR